MHLLLNPCIALLWVCVWLGVHLLRHQVALSIGLSLGALTIVLVLLPRLNLTFAHGVLAPDHLVLSLVLHLSISFGH